MYDVFFLSYDEPHADTHWALLKSHIPYAQRVEGVDGIQAAHLRCSNLSKTPHFFVVDADNEVTDFSPFEYTIPAWDRDYVHLWFARNPVNGLEYGWGGLKLFPRSVFNRDGPFLDMTTSFPLKMMKTVVSITHFNTSPYEAWRSGFREGVKLVQHPSDEQAEWLRVWQTVGHGPHADAVMRGANEGAEYGRSRQGDDLMRINDYAWLRDRFEAQQPRSSNT